jgi:tetratricopeptide (TPR) repeat protein
MPGAAYDPSITFFLGLAQQYNGQDQEAHATWNVGLARWPRNELMVKAINGPKRTVYEWTQIERDISDPMQAERLARCGFYYSELGIQDRAADCFRRADARVPGTGLAYELVFLGGDKTKLDEAINKTTAVLAQNPHPPAALLTATAWLHLRKGNIPEARRWVLRAFEVNPADVKATSLMWQLCGEGKDYLCVLEYRKRLGLPTHFNQEQYRDATKAWQEQAKRNGVGLAGREPDSTVAPKPPKISTLVIIPLGARVPAELKGIEQLIADELPGVKVSMGPLEDLPAGAYKPEKEFAVWDVLLDRLREEPGRIYVIEEDLVAIDTGFAFTKIDLAHGRAVVSLSRLRSLVGLPTVAGTTLDQSILPAARNRAHAALLEAAAKLSGLSFPCTSEACALREHRAVTDFVLPKPAFCEKHRTEMHEAVAPARK